MVAKLETVLKACMSAKQASLRPEIQLLNILLACNTEDQRRQVCHRRETGIFNVPGLFDSFSVGITGRVSGKRSSVFVLHPGSAGL